jgi:hypothetical protein
MYQGCCAIPTLSTVNVSLTTKCLWIQGGWEPTPNQTSNVCPPNNVVKVRVNSHDCTKPPIFGKKEERCVTLKDLQKNIDWTGSFIMEKANQSIMLLYDFNMSHYGVSVPCKGGFLLTISEGVSKGVSINEDEVESDRDPYQEDQDFI